jgi:threonine/homoserine/homoserine lactone efflux protein
LGPQTQLGRGRFVNNNGRGRRVRGGYGIAGRVFFPIAIVYTIIAIFVGSHFGSKGELIAILVTVGALVLTYLSGGIDAYCSHHSYC